MFLRQKATSWSSILLRDEILHAGIRPVRTALKTAVSHAVAEEAQGVSMAALSPDGTEADRVVSC